MLEDILPVSKLVPSLRFGRAVLGDGTRYFEGSASLGVSNKASWASGRTEIIRHFEGSTSLGGSLLGHFEGSRGSFEMANLEWFVFRPCEIRNDGSSVRLGVSKRYSLDIGFRLVPDFYTDWDAKAQERAPRASGTFKVEMDLLSSVFKFGYRTPRNLEEPGKFTDTTLRNLGEPGLSRNARQDYELDFGRK
ncbi:uncharacterized protein OCT59_004634 [Rhizophagus irregularis]|uniref:uncharacterized protein n=1 Tax=Rhizophagus irregularis TaxID=588596 RepID=UPI00332A0AF2|nr:hypothetical protein OCT59_004634 [Rhizophagus irregularis]